MEEWSAERVFDTKKEAKDYVAKESKGGSTYAKGGEVLSAKERARLEELNLSGEVFSAKERARLEELDLIDHTFNHESGEWSTASEIKEEKTLLDKYRKSSVYDYPHEEDNDRKHYDFLLLAREKHRNRQGGSTYAKGGEISSKANGGWGIDLNW